MSGKALNLEDLVTSRPKIEFGTAEIDVTHLFPNQEKVLFKFREPSAASLFKLRSMVPDVKMQRPDWPEEYAAAIAMLAAHHIEPAPTRYSTMVLYCNLADTLGLVELKDLLQAFAEAFPGLGHLEQAVADEKNALTAES